MYQPDQLLALLANAENTESEGRELERRAKRYWLLLYLQQELGDRPFEAIALRGGNTAELEAYAIRGSLRGAPNLPTNARILVRIGRVEPMRGWLALDYLSTLNEMHDAPGTPGFAARGWSAQPRHSRTRA
jgi:hypothetical protein